MQEKNGENKNLAELLKGRENYFDLIRLIAAVLVIFSHAYPLSGSGKEDPLYQFTNGQITLGNLAVCIFFIISGLLITNSYLYSDNIITFLKARLLRIFPGLIGVIFVSTFLLGPMVTSLSFVDYIRNEGVVQYLKAVFLFPMQWSLPGVFEENAYKGVVNGSLWTIPFEFLCYLLIGLFGVFRLLRKRLIILLITIMTFYCYVFFDQINPAGSGHFLGLEIKTIIELLMFFLIGCIACLFKDKITFNKKVVMMGLITIFVSMVYGGFKPLFAVFGSYIILYLAFLPQSRLSKITSFGDFSYGIYLYAFPIQQLVTFWYGGQTSVLANFSISMPITLVFAVISWNIVEKNSLKLKNKFKVEKLPPIYTQRINGFLDKLYNMNWKKFSVLFVIFILCLQVYNLKPNVVEFPYRKSESIFSGGWLPQGNAEDYRWISGKGNIEMQFRLGNSSLKIEGFTPEHYIEINKVKLYLNERQIYEEAITPGKGFFLEVPIQAEKKNNQISIEFNAVHIPSDSEADKREMSALISKIQVVN